MACLASEIARKASSGASSFKAKSVASASLKSSEQRGHVARNLLSDFNSAMIFLDAADTDFPIGLSDASVLVSGLFDVLIEVATNR